MGRYRSIHRGIWNDEDFLELNADDKLLFLYLITNKALTESGIYRVSLKTISFETSIPLETVSKRFGNGLFKNVKYDADNKLIYIINARKYNNGGNPKMITASIQADYNECPTSPLWKLFQDNNPDISLKKNSNGLETVSKPFDSDSDSDIVDNSFSTNHKREHKGKGFKGKGNGRNTDKYIEGEFGAVVKRSGEPKEATHATN